MVFSHKPCIFRLFVNSIFGYFISEREALQNEVLPELGDYCAKRGARFQAIDRRRGISEDAQHKYETMRIYLDEVRRCQQLSPRLDFVTLLGQRYGWEPILARISLGHCKRLINAVSSVDRKLIDDSFMLDKTLSRRFIASVNEPRRRTLPGTRSYVWQAGKIREIADYCKSDVLNTYRLFL